MFMCSTGDECWSFNLEDKTAEAMKVVRSDSGLFVSDEFGIVARYQPSSTAPSPTPNLLTSSVDIFSSK